MKNFSELSEKELRQQLDLMSDSEKDILIKQLKKENVELREKLNNMVMPTLN